MALFENKYQIWDYADSRDYSLYDSIIEKARDTENELRQAAEKKAETKLVTIQTIRESIPVVTALLKRQTEVNEQLEFSLRMETYSDGLFDLLKESKIIIKKLEEYEPLIEELATIKLGY